MIGRQDKIRLEFHVFFYDICNLLKINILFTSFLQKIPLIFSMIVFLKSLFL